MTKLIYVADDDPVCREMVKAFLEREGLDVDCFENGDSLYEAFIKKTCNLIILDVLMPGSDGFTTGAKIRQISDLPIIMLTGQESDDDYIFGISLGFDAYLTKPFNPAKLIAHVRTLLMKAALNRPAQGTEKPAVITYADMVIDTNKMAVQCHGESLPLTNTEFSLLRYMFENLDRAVPREELLNKVWGFDSIVGTRAIDDTIKRLRKKLADANSTVSVDTVRGFGFRISAEE